MKISIGTTSELKVRALKTALEKLNVSAEVISLKTQSGISDQPFGYSEMLKGAKNRANAVLSESSADISIGVENGLVEIEENFFDIACVYLKTNDGEESIAYSSGYFTPNWIIDEIRETNTEYGVITQRLSGDSEKDPLKYFSEGKIKREELLSQAIEIALIKIFNKEKYQQS